MGRIVILRQYQVLTETSEERRPGCFVLAKYGCVSTTIRHNIDENGTARARGTIMLDDSVTVILQGVLSDDDMVGQLVSGIGQFNGRGCSYRVSFRTDS